MRVNFSTNTMSCQPLKFGKSEYSSKNNNTANAPAFTSGTVSREEYDRLSAKYEIACRIAAAQAEQYNKLVANYKK